MIRFWRFSTTGVLLTLVLMTGAVTAGAQSPTDGSTPAAGQPTDVGADAVPEVTVPVTDHDLARIRRALESAPAVRIDDDELRFYMQILVAKPTFAEFAKGYDFQHGPTRGGNPMTHDEFVAMVTPKEMQSSVGITARETLEFALTNWLAQTLIKKAFEDLQEARTEAEIQQIRDRIDRELAALKSAGGGR